MPGWLSDGTPQLNGATGAETFSVDTNASSGANPQTGAFQLAQLANLVSYFGNGLSKTMVANTRYNSTINFGFPQTITNLCVRVGATGGTDNWILELHSPSGVLLANTALAGTTAGTAATWQVIPLVTPYTVTNGGVYSVSLISNGTTATFDALNAPSNAGVFTSSSSGTFGTGASITPPTTYTANLGPRVLVT